MQDLQKQLDYNKRKQSHIQSEIARLLKQKVELKREEEAIIQTIEKAGKAVQDGRIIERWEYNAR